MATQRPKYRFTGVKKDPLDLRDRYYKPSLEELPAEVDNWERVPRILDQQQEGACVGFATAAVVNYLLRNRSDRTSSGKSESVSARMLYEMAKRYDEWEGADYEGSSIRGAMKGWQRHGVCAEKLWEYRVEDPGRPSADALLDARKHPLGAYYRVRHRHLNHMHSAINETGIVLASADVHVGWYEVDLETGKIPYRPGVEGGHAFAIIGYDDEGFWIQNSWGEDWGCLELRPAVHDAAPVPPGDLDPDSERPAPEPAALPEEHRALSAQEKTDSLPGPAVP